VARKKWIDHYFGERLKLERGHRNWTQADMVERLKAEGITLHWTSLAKIEKGERSVRIDEAKAIADVLELSIDSMLGRKAGLEDDLSHALRGVLDAAHQAQGQITLMMRPLNDRFKDVNMLEFEGYEALQSDITAAWDALQAAADALEHLAEFQPPKEVRIATVIEQLLRRQDKDDETQP
jgi:transcriptional regulator with XRE-family HTH domain